MVSYHLLQTLRLLDNMLTSATIQRQFHLLLMYARLLHMFTPQPRAQMVIMEIGIITIIIIIIDGCMLMLMVTICLHQQGLMLTICLRQQGLMLTICLRQQGLMLTICLCQQGLMLTICLRQQGLMLICQHQGLICIRFLRVKGKSLDKLSILPVIYHEQFFSYFCVVFCWGFGLKPNKNFDY